jgi:uncharacterized repeat protein (TIGR01451 family)
LAPGAALAYTLVVTNNGPLPSDGAQVVDVLPPGVNFVSATGCVNTAGTVRCAVGPLAVNASRTFTINTTLSSPYTGARPLVNSASVDAPGDTDPSNNTATAPTIVSGNANNVPTLSEWSLILLAAVLGLFAWQQPALRRRL